MNLKVFAGAIALGGLMALAVLAGGIVAQPASAGVPPTLPGQAAAQTAQPTATRVTGTPQPGAPQPGKPFGRSRDLGGRGHGPGHGPGGGQYTAEGASRAISSTTSLITLVRGDLAYATGKMDTATVQAWLNQADGLVRTAQSASGSSQYGRAVETASAASKLASAAELLMRQALGAANLPSASQRGFRGRGGLGPGTATGVTQAHASRELAGLYNAIVMKQALLNRAGSAGDATNYLNAAKDYYRTAHTAYQAGNYDSAHASAAVGQTLLGVVDSLLRAATAPNNADTPVQVPAPNF